MSCMLKWKKQTFGEFYLENIFEWHRGIFKANTSFDDFMIELMSSYSHLIHSQFMAFWIWKKIKQIFWILLLFAYTKKKFLCVSCEMKKEEKKNFSSSKYFIIYFLRDHELKSKKFEAAQEEKDFQIFQFYVAKSQRKTKAIFHNFSSMKSFFLFVQEKKDSLEREKKCCKI